MEEVQGEFKMNWLGEMVQKHITENDTVLSLGCGIFNESKGLRCKNITGIDIYEPYVKKLTAEGYEIILDDITKHPFKEKSYDVIIALDVLEHLCYTDAVELLNKMKQIARKKVIIYTPIEFHDNINNVKTIHITKNSPYNGLGENRYQMHQCLIKQQDLLNNDYKIQETVNGGYFAIFEVN